MKNLIFILIVSMALIGCQTQPKQALDYGGALPELYRADTPQAEPYPNYYHAVSHTCTSTPIYDAYGYYVRTDVRCR